MTRDPRKYVRPIASRTGWEFGDHLGAVDVLPHTIRLETQYEVASYLERLYGPSSAVGAEVFTRMLEGREHAMFTGSDQFRQLLVATFLISDHQKALASFRLILPSDTDEELAKLLNEVEFKRLHSDVQFFVSSRKVVVEEECRSRLSKSGDYIRLDREAFDFSSIKSVESGTQNSVKLSIQGKNRHILRGRLRTSEKVSLPLSEFAKNDRIIDVGSFDSAKITHAVHDLIDHLWFAQILREAGVLDRYRHLLSSIGNPDIARHFSRESEIFASIGFGTRLRHNMPHGMFTPVRPEILLKLLRSDRDYYKSQAAFILERVCRNTSVGTDNFDYSKSYDPRTYAERIKDHRLLPIQRTRRGLEYASLSFVYSNYLTELNEQRRKHGKIKVFSGNKVLGELNPFCPAFIGLFVEAHHELMKPSNKHLDRLTAAHAQIEYYLTELATSENFPTSPTELILDLNSLNDTAIFASLRPETIQWIRSNPGYMASKQNHSV